MIRNLLVIFLLCSTALAQDKSSPETVLAGIDILHTTVPDIIKLYGPPEGVYAAPEPYPAGTKQYKWGRLTVTLRVLTEPTSSGDKVTAIQIDGDGDGKPVSRTGRGLKLGDKPGAIHKLYGVDPVGPSTTVQWPNGPTLLIRTNAKSHIDRIELSLKSNPWPAATSPMSPTVTIKPSLVTLRLKFSRGDNQWAKLTRKVKSYQCANELWNCGKCSRFTPERHRRALFANISASCRTAFSSCSRKQPPIALLPGIAT